MTTLTRDTLLARVRDGGGSTQLSDAVRLFPATYRDSPAVRAEVTLGPHRYTFLLYQHIDGVADFLPTEAAYLRDAPTLAAARTALAEALGLTAPTTKPY